MTKTQEGRISSLEASFQSASDLAARDRSEMKDDIKAIHEAVKASAAGLNSKLDALEARITAMENARLEERSKIRGVMWVLGVIAAVGGSLITKTLSYVVEFFAILPK